MPAAAMYIAATDVEAALHKSGVSRYAEALAPITMLFLSNALIVVAERSRVLDALWYVGARIDPGA